MQSRAFSVSACGVFCLKIALSLVLAVQPLVAQPDVPTDRGQVSQPEQFQLNGDAEPGPDLEFPSNPVEDILFMWERLTGKRVIRDAALAGPPMTILARGITRNEAIRLIESSLLLNGYTFIQMDARTVKIINSGSRNPRGEGVALYASSALLPSDERVVTYFMPLQFISPEDANAVFSQLVTLHPYGIIVPVKNAQALLITESTTVIRKLISVRELIDVPPAKVTTEFVQLVQANAEKVAEQINSLLEKRSSGSTSSNSAPPAITSPDGSPTPAGMAPNLGPTEKSLVSGETQIHADARTNRILIITRPSNIDYLRGLIRLFDVSVGLNEPYERPLQHIAASEVLPLLADLLKEGDEEVDMTTGNPSQSGGRTPSTNNEFGMGGSRGVNSRSSRFGRSSSGGGVVRSDTLQEPDSLPVAESARVGPSITLIADNRANSILVIAPPEAKEKARTLLDALDKRPQQVFLSCVIGQMTLGEGKELGFDYLLRSISDGTHDVAGLLRSRGASEARPIINPSKLFDPEVFPLVPGLSIYATLDQTLDVYVSMLESTNRFRVLARPTVYTTNNKKAVILSGQRVAVPTSTLTDTASVTRNASSFVSNIQYEEVALKLEVIPLINQNREVTLQISQTNDSIVGSQNISGNDIPTIGTQEISTTITVPDGRTIALGGLIQEQIRRNRSGAPLLSRVPVLGYLFRRTENSKERSELIVLIQPRVVTSVDEGIQASRIEQMRVSPGRDILDSEAFPPIPPKPPKPAKGPRSPRS